MMKMMGSCSQRVLVLLYSISAFRLRSSRLIYLVDDVDAVVNPLPSEDRVEVVEPVLKVVFSVTERDDDGHLNNRDSTFLSIKEPLKCIIKSMLVKKTKNKYTQSRCTI